MNVVAAKSQNDERIRKSFSNNLFHLFSLPYLLPIAIIIHN